MARPTTSARRYAEAAFEIAERDRAIEQWRDQLEAAARALTAEEVASVLENPAVPLETRSRIVEQAVPRAEPGVRKLLLVLLQRGRLELAPQIAAEFRRLFNQRAGIREARAISASPLTEQDVSALRTRLESLTGGKVDLTLDVDESLIGGVVVRVGDRLIDGSVRGRLERLRNQLAAGSF